MEQEVKLQSLTNERIISQVQELIERSSDRNFLRGYLYIQAKRVLLEAQRVASYIQLSQSRWFPPRLEELDSPVSDLLQAEAVIYVANGIREGRGGSVAASSFIELDRLFGQLVGEWINETSLDLRGLGKLEIKIRRLAGALNDLAIGTSPAERTGSVN